MATVLQEPSGGTGALAGDDRRLKKDFSLIGLLFTAIGSIIGSGWLFSSLHASQQAGPASLISWVVGGIMFVFIGLAYSELGVMFPHTGGVARYPHYAFGSFVSYSMGWVTWLACAAVAAVEVSAVLTYATAYLPWLEHSDQTLTPSGIGVAVGLMAVFVIINFLGVRWFSRINQVLVWWKLLMISMVIAALLILGFHGSHLSDFGGFTPYGLHGAFAAIPAAAIAFSFFGFRQGIEMAGETSNPRRNVPLTVVGSVVICGILYFLLQLAYLGAVPTSALQAGGWAHADSHFPTFSGSAAEAFAPLAVLASFIGLGWLAVLLYADAIISPSDTGMLYFGVTSRMSYAMGRNRNAPAALAKVNNNGVPWVSLFLAFVVGCLFFLPFPSWQALVGIVTSMTVLSFGSGPIALVTFRKQIPDQERPYRLKGVWVIAFLALLSTNLIIYWAGWNQVWKMMLAIVLGYILLVIHQLYAGMRGTSLPQLDFRHGWWVLAWFAGITITSYVGSYSGTSSADSGQLNIMGFGGGVIGNIVLTALVLALAWYSQLPGERVKQILAHRDDEEPEPVTA
ncbi:MAG TPA: APC family permease [Nocardioidaceae bacterium]|nr:APC family permease [Nocardioidaceae bacterium]